MVASVASKNVSAFTGMSILCITLLLPSLLMSFKTMLLELWELNSFI